MKPPAPPPPNVWWLIWGGITAAFFTVMGILDYSDMRVEAPPVAAFVALVPFAASAAVRFILLPRVPAESKFIFFIIGLASAEAGGLLSLLLVSPWSTPLTAAAIVLMILHIPAFIRRT